MTTYKCLNCGTETTTPEVECCELSELCMNDSALFEMLSNSIPALTLKESEFTTLNTSTTGE